MKSLLILFATATLAVASDAPKIEYQRGKCLANLRPSKLCKTCEHCNYCGKDKGRSANSATCVVCEKARADKARK